MPEVISNLAKSVCLMMNNNNPMTDKDRIELREKILKGITLAVEKLIRSKQKTNGELVYSKDGKIVFIKAKDLVK